MTTATTSQAGALRLQVGRDGLVAAEGHVPYAARVVHGRPGWTKVVLVQTTAGPLAGDVIELDVELDDGARLELTSNAALLALPASHSARIATRVHAGAGARLAWLPEPLVVAEGSRLELSLDLRLAAGAAAVVRELVVLGRHGEEAIGRYRARLRCELDGRPLLHDAVDTGAAASAAVLGGARAYGSLGLLGRVAEQVDRDELELAGPGRVVRVVAGDAATLVARIAPVERRYLAILSR